MSQRPRHEQVAGERRQEVVGRKPGPQGRCDDGFRQEADARHRGHRQSHLADAGHPEWARLRYPHWEPDREREDTE
eukprot:8780470-Heterocapsa_arctica.AAC.1